MANEESEWSASVLEIVPSHGVSAGSWTAFDSWEQLLEMSSENNARRASFAWH